MIDRKLIEKIEGLHDDIAVDVIAGNCTPERYQSLCGEMRGLKRAVQIIEAARREANDDED